MNIPAVPAIDRLSNTIPPLDPGQNHAASNELKLRFSELMQRTEAAPRSGEQSGTNAVGQLVQREQDSIQGHEANMDNLLKSIPTMGPAEAAAAAARIMHESATIGFTLQVGSALGQNAHKGLDTLLNNK